MKRMDFTILVVDDSKDDLALIVAAFHQMDVRQKMQTCDCGSEAIDYLTGAGKFADRELFPYPAFLITDLKMPKGDGFSILQHILNTPEYKIIPTLVYSASADPADIQIAYDLGASSYLVKPNDYGQTRKLFRTVYDYWLQCEKPEVDGAGRRVQTYIRGKIGEKYMHGS